MTSHSQQKQQHHIPHHNQNNYSTSPESQYDHSRQSKRKSNAHLAAEIVQQERDAIRALKRLSMGGGSFNIDPDFQIALESEYTTDAVTHTLEKKKQRRKSGSSLSSDSDDLDKTLINDDDENQYNFTNDNNNEISIRTLNEEESPVLKATAHNQNIIKKLDTEKLLWVPAKSHPKIAPEKFRRHVQNTLEDFNSNNNNNNYADEPEEIRRVRRIRRKSSIPSLKELTDELDRLSEMAGLAATDAVTLARSLSSTSFNNQHLNHLTDERLANPAPTSPVDGSPNLSESPASEFEIDEDAPILGYANSLRRNQFSTVSRSTRGKRYHKIETKPESKLSHEAAPLLPEASTSQPIVKEKLSPIDKGSKDIDGQTQKQPQRDEGDFNYGTLNPRGRSPELSSEVSKRTNHSRNRHAGSVIGLDVTQKDQKPLKETENELPFLMNNKFNQKLKKMSSKYDLQFSLRSDEKADTVKKQEESDSSDSENVFLEPAEQPQPISAKSKSKSKEFLNLFRKKRSASSSTTPPPPQPSNDSIVDKKLNTANRSISFDDSSLASSKSTEDNQTLSSKLSLRTSPKKRSSREPLQPQPTSTQKASPSKTRPSSLLFSSKKKECQTNNSSIPPAPLPTRSLSPPTSQPHSPQQTQFSGLATTEEQHRLQREALEKRLLSNSSPSSKPNAPLRFQDSAFGFPLPPLSRSTIVMLDYRFPIHVERALYRLSHLKLANPKRELRQQVLLSNFMYAYLNLVNHTLYLQQLDEDHQGQSSIQGNNGSMLG